MKKAFNMLLILLMALVLLPAAVSADEAETTPSEYVYLSISFDGVYINDTTGTPIMYVPVSLADIQAVDLTEYGLDNMLYDADGDGNYETTALQLIIYAHENLYGGSWSDVNFSALPGSSYFAGGIFGFTENLVYFHNGYFPVDESQTSDYMTVGATSDRIVLQDGDFLDIASFSCYGFLWDSLGGFHFFGDSDGNFVHEYQLNAGDTLSARLIHSFCDLMSGAAWTMDAQDYPIYYGTTYGNAEATFITDAGGIAEITFDEPGTYYLWCAGGNGAEENHSWCDYYYATGEPCIVSSPAYAKVIVESSEPEKIDFSYARMVLGNALEFQFAIPQDGLNNLTGAYAVIEKQWADGSTTTKTIPADQWDSTTISGKQYWAIVYDGLAAKEMADCFHVTVFGADGTAITNTKTDSVRDYVARAYDSQTATGKTMMVDMLNYGAAAQLHFGYNTGDLANNALTDQQNAVGTAETPAMNNNVVKGNKYLGTRFILESSIQVQLAFQGLTEDMYAIYSFTNNEGTKREVRVEGTSFIRAGAMTGIELSELVYADARAMVNVTVYNADASTYGTASDSIESCAARSTTGDDVFTALMKFADSAKAHLYG